MSGGIRRLDMHADDLNFSRANCGFFFFLLWLGSFDAHGYLDLAAHDLPGDQAVQTHQECE
jgi:hypothetical protein